MGTRASSPAALGPPAQALTVAKSSRQAGQGGGTQCRWHLRWAPSTVLPWGSSVGRGLGVLSVVPAPSAPCTSLLGWLPAPAPWHCTGSASNNTPIPWAPTASSLSRCPAGCDGVPSPTSASPGSPSHVLVLLDATGVPCQDCVVSPCMSLLCWGPARLGHHWRSSRVH